MGHKDNSVYSSSSSTFENRLGRWDPSGESNGLSAAVSFLRKEIYTFLIAKYNIILSLTARLGLPSRLDNESLIN